MKDVNVGIFTHRGAITRDDGPRQQVWLAGKKKVAFDIMTEKDIMFTENHAIRRNLGKLPIIDMPSAFDPPIEAGPSQQHGTL